MKSKKATRFRVGNFSSKEYMIRGYVLDEVLVKNGTRFGKDYFNELLEKIREIRSSERRLYQKVTDIFAQCSYDYDSNSKVAQDFYASIQNKLHYAITGQTAAEIIAARAGVKRKTWDCRLGKTLLAARF